MKSLLGLILLAGLCTNAYATTLTFADPTTVNGATGIITGGKSWDVVLLDGKCVDLFNGCDEDSDFAPIQESDELDVRNVLIGLLTEINAQGYNQTNIFGCGNPSNCNVHSPIGYDELGMTVLTGFGSFIGTNISGGPQAINPERDFGAENVLAWARVTPSPIPVPAAAWLFGTALIGLFGLKRMRKTNR